MKTYVLPLEPTSIVVTIQRKKMLIYRSVRGYLPRDYVWDRTHITKKENKWLNKALRLNKWTF